MKILSFNVNNDYRNTSENAEAIAGMIARSDPDIVGLQEVTPMMYDALFSVLKDRHGYNVSARQTRSYFNVMMSKFPDAISETAFTTTTMARTFLTQHVAALGATFVTTHLESMPQNKSVRALQCLQICEHLRRYGGPVTVFGDTNFCHDDEDLCGCGLAYVESYTGGVDVFTYDSLLNPNASKPFRTNLDRFYTSHNVTSHNSTLDILVDVTFSDHFPIVLTLT